MSSSYEKMMEGEEKRKAKERLKREHGRRVYNLGRKMFNYGLAGLIICAVVFGANWLALSITAEGEFNKAVHGHIVNAYWASDPYTLETEIEQAIEGLHELGLESGMSSRYWSWEQTPDNSIAWEYKHLQSVVDRCDEFETWIAEQNGTGSQQMQDVYSQKLNNIRTFISPDDGNTWSDDIAHDAYLLKHYEFQVIWLKMILTILLPLTIAMPILGFFLKDVGRDEYRMNGGGSEDE